MPGMVTTVEPGIYIRPNKPEIEFKLLERDPKEIRERRKLLGMEKATKLENEEMKDAKSIKHIIPKDLLGICLLYTSPSPRDRTRSRMPSSA